MRSFQNNVLNFPLAMTAAIAVHAALVLPFLTRAQAPIQIPQPELSVTIAPPSQEARPDAAGFQSLANRQGAGDNARVERLSTAKLGMAADAPTDPTTQQGHGQGADAANQASALHTQGEQRRTTTPGRVILNQNAATLTRGNASDVLLAELDFNKIQLSGQGSGDGQANATIKNARAGYVHRWRQHIQTVGSDFAQARTHLVGEVKLAATLDFQGRLTGYQILNSSGMSELDQAAIELLKRASPFDPFPNALVAYQTELTITRIWQFNQGQHTLR